MPEDGLTAALTALARRLVDLSSRDPALRADLRAAALAIAAATEPESVPRAQVEPAAECEPLRPLTLGQGRVAPLPRGSSPNQVAAEILAQCSERPGVAPDSWPARPRPDVTRTRSQPPEPSMPARRLALALPALAALALVPATAAAQGLEYVKAHYTKYDHRIPMRDGVKLFTSVYVPKDASPTNRYPILIQRTPYSVAPYGIDQYESDLGPSSLFGRAGYIVAYQDVRGRFLSEGEFVDMRPHNPSKSGAETDESSDTYDTIDWLVKNVPHNNGKAGIWGISWPGTFAANALIDAHPALKAASPQAPMCDWFLGDDVHHNGAFFLQQEFNFDATFGVERTGPTTKWSGRFDHGTPDGYAFFLDLGPLSNANAKHFKGKHRWWDQVMAHGAYDEFWRSRALLRHVKAVAPAVLTVGGWFDAEDLYGPLNLYRTVESTGPKSENALVMGPWTHGGWSRGEGQALGAVDFASKTAEFYRESIEFPFFERHLKGKGDAKPVEAWMFETGRNQWHTLDAWPPAEAREGALYLGAGGALGFEPPAAAADGDPGFDEYPSDPAKPVPSTATVTINTPSTYMVEDQRFAARRPDVLVYRTEPLDRDVTLAGPLRAELVVSTTGSDADFVVKLIDVYPDDRPDPDPNPAGVRLGGYQQLVRGEVMRGKFRESFEAPRAFTPGEPTPVAFAVQDVFHTFRPGHRIMVQVQSSWFPLVDRNPQTFVDIYNAKADDFRAATHRVYRSPGRASRLVARFLP